MINATAVMGWVDIDNNPHVSAAGRVTDALRSNVRSSRNSSSVLPRRNPDLRWNGMHDLVGARMQVEVFDLWAKNVEYIQESYDQFTVTDTSIEYIQQNHLVLRFRRKFDTVFRPDVQQVSAI